MVGCHGSRKIMVRGRVTSPVYFLRLRYKRLVMKIDVISACLKFCFGWNEALLVVNFFWDLCFLVAMLSLLRREACGYAANKVEIIIEPIG